MSYVVLNLICVVYNAFLVTGTTYLVAVLDWSMWTYLLCMCFMVSVNKRDKNATTTKG